MKKLKRIIVGIDISEKSNNVLKRALIIAKRNKADLFIVHAVQTPWLSVPSYFGGKEISIDLKGIRKKIEKKIKTLNRDSEVPYTVLVKEGAADDVILYEAKLLKAELIVIGSNTKSKKKFLGSTAEKVAHKSHLPVLIVKNSVKKPYQNILAPTDFQAQSKQSILFAKNIFPAATIKVFHAYESFYASGPYTADAYNIAGFDLEEYDIDVKKYAQNNLKDFIQEINIKKGGIIDGEFNSKEILLKYINKGSFDLVVIGSRGTTGFTALLGSVAASIIRDAKNDVLVYVP